MSASFEPISGGGGGGGGSGSSNGAVGGEGPDAKRARKAVLVGDAGGEYIRNLLCKTNPKIAVPEFRKTNSLSVEGSQPALELLGVLGLSRLECHKAVLYGLKKKLLDMVEQTDDVSKLFAVLNASFPYISVEELRPIPIAAMQRMPKIPHAYTEMMCSDKELLKHLPTSLRRVCFESTESAFCEHMCPLMERFVQAPEMLNLQMEMRPSTTKRRHHTIAVVKDIVELVSGSSILYSMLLSRIKANYHADRNPAWACLRLELAAVMHETGNSQKACEVDPWNSLARLLRSCYADADINIKKTTEISSALADMNQPGTTEELWMMCSSLQLLYSLYRHIIVGLHRVLDLMGDASTDRILVNAAHLLTIGLSHTPKKVLKPERELMKTMLPLIIVSMGNDALSAGHSLKGDNRFELVPALLHCMSTCPVAKKIFLFYALDRAEADDEPKFVNILDVISEASAGGALSLASEMAFVSSVVAAILDNKTMQTYNVITKTIKLLETHIRASATCNCQLVYLVCCLASSGVVTAPMVNSTVNSCSRAALEQQAFWEKHMATVISTYEKSIDKLMQCNNTAIMMEAPTLRNAITQLTTKED